MSSSLVRYMDSSGIEPYPEYRNPPIKWLHRIPINWEIHRAKYLFKRMNRPVRSSDEIVTAFRDGIVTLRKNRRTEGFTNSLKEIGYQGVRKGDLVIHAMDGFAGAIGVSDSDGKSTPVYSVCVPYYDVSTKYYAYLIRTMALNGYIKSLAKGIRERSTEFRYNEFKNLELIVPSLTEQQAIATFLDRETSRIDALVEKKQQFIELLEERRSALISHAVTKGLDPDVPMKDSGIEWIGEIPEHWNILSIKRAVNKFVDYRGATPTKIQEGIPLITAKNIKHGHINFELSQEYISKTMYKEWMTRGFPQYGDVLITTEAPLGETAQIVDENIALAQRIILIKVNTTVLLNSYLKYYLLSNSGQWELYGHATGSTALGIKASRLKMIKLTIPPLQEQQAIADYLDRETSQIDTLIEKTEQSIEYLKEYRTALISSAVTGKIDVRGTVSD